MIRTSLFLLLVALGACDEKKTETPPAPAASATASAAPVASAAAPATASAAPASSAVPESIAAQHVLVAWKGAKGAPKNVTRSKADAKKRAEEVASKAKSGTDFSTLVAEYTDDEGTKDRRGSLGMFKHASKVKPFADAAFALAVDAISDPVETEFGYHVIKRNQ